MHVYSRYRYHPHTDSQYITDDGTMWVVSSQAFCYTAASLLIRYGGELRLWVLIKDRPLALYIGGACFKTYSSFTDAIYPCRAADCS